ncbi:hypothetical protein PIB30_114600, partial [Stylosanthes scabra]|nr:hypothetical protein [Stylosanthes scabra]
QWTLSWTTARGVMRESRRAASWRGCHGSVAGRAGGSRSAARLVFSGRGGEETAVGGGKGTPRQGRVAEGERERLAPSTGVAISQSARHARQKEEMTE